MTPNPRTKVRGFAYTGGEGTKGTEATEGADTIPSRQEFESEGHGFPDLDVVDAEEGRVVGGLDVVHRHVDVLAGGDVADVGGDV